MALPTKKIKKIQIPEGSDNVTYEIIPDRLQNSGYEAALPTLSADSVLALTSDIPVVPTVNDAALTIQGNGTAAATFSANQSTAVTLNIKGSGSTTVSKTAAGEITISSTDNNDNQTVKVGTATFGVNAAIAFTGTNAATVTANTANNLITIDVPVVTNTNQTVKVGSTTFTASAAIDLVAGSNVQITAATNGTGAPKITFSATDTTYSIATSISASASNSEVAGAKAVYDAIEALPEPMIFKGSVGDGGTVTWINLPAATSSEGWTYKVITAHSTAPVCKVGDTIISNGTSWVVIPSGDEPDGTVTSVGLTMPTGFTVSSSPITSSGTIAVTFANGYSIPTTTKQSEWDAKQDVAGYQPIIVLEDNGSTTAGTWLAKTSKITSLVDGQLFLYKLVVAGASTTKITITANGRSLGAKTIYRYGTTKLSTQYAVGEHVLLEYVSASSAFKVVNDYDADTNTKVRQYQTGTTARTGTQYPILTRYATTDKAGSYDANYVRYNTDTYVDTSTGYVYAPKLYSNGTEVATINDIPTVNNAALTIQRNSTTLGTFTANASTAVTVNISVPTADSGLTNDRYVRYDTSSQGLTTTQKSNARTNIGAGTYSKPSTGIPGSDLADSYVTTNTLQTITVRKTFDAGALYVTNVFDTSYETPGDGGALTLSGHLTVFGDNDEDDDKKPTNQTSATDLDTYYYNTGITLTDADEEMPIRQLSFPDKSGTLAVTTDLPQVYRYI